MKRKWKIALYVILSILALGGAAAIIWSSTANSPAPAVTPIPTPSPTPIREIVIQTEEKFIEVEREITSEIIEDGLNDIGFLLTEEYYFKDVLTFSDTKKLWNHDIGLTESSYIATYDGTITAGINFTDITIQKDDENKIITISMPKAVIQSVIIDPESFELHSEKNSVWNPISVTDFNDSLIKLESDAEEKAIDRGILEQAAENAKKVIESFIASLIDTTEYSIKYINNE